MKWYLKGLKQYADFSGRASREEYWMYMLFAMIFAIVAMALDNMLGLASANTGYYGPIYGLFALATIIPGWAISIRRLHDVGKSGWMWLIVLIPLAGGIWLLILMIRPGEDGNNAYGPSPRIEDSNL